MSRDIFQNGGPSGLPFLCPVSSWPAAGLAQLAAGAGLELTRPGPDLGPK